MSNRPRFNWDALAFRGCQAGLAQEMVHAGELLWTPFQGGRWPVWRKCISCRMRPMKAPLFGVPFQGEWFVKRPYAVFTS